ncbi:MAG: hypothetical protein KGO92_09235 [Bacteroidota bacterium]|nr:hypothetical protein [Bacteroidota bacterium]
MTKSFNRVKIFAVLYICVTLLALLFRERLAMKEISSQVIIGGNTLLLVFSLLNLYFQEKNLNNPNANAVIRGVMAGTFLKLMGLAAAALIYLVASGSSRSVNAVFVCMGLYIIYTWLEVRLSLRMKPKK